MECLTDENANSKYSCLSLQTFMRDSLTNLDISVNSIDINRSHNSDGDDFQTVKATDNASGTSEVDRMETNTEDHISYNYVLELQHETIEYVTPVNSKMPDGSSNPSYIDDRLLVTDKERNDDVENGRYIEIEKLANFHYQDYDEFQDTNKTVDVNNHDTITYIGVSSIKQESKPLDELLYSKQDLNNVKEVTGDLENKSDGHDSSITNIKQELNEDVKSDDLEDAKDIIDDFKEPDFEEKRFEVISEFDEDFNDEIDEVMEQKKHKKRKGRKQSQLTWEERLICTICGKKFTHPCNRLAHEKMVHRNLKPRVCGICGRGFYSSANLKKHMNSHTGNRPYTCPICNKGFTQPGNVKRHMQSHSLVASYKCPICQRAFKEQGNMKRHLETHSDVKKYVCKICSKPFRTSSNLQRHIEMIHNKSRNYFCQICKKSYSCADSIKLHMKIHTDERNHLCPKCGKRFLVRTALKRHLDTHLKQDEFKFKCGICNNMYRSLETLTDHMVCHTSGNMHICHVCNKSFPNAIILKEHKLSHSEKKPYVCQVCNKAFSTVHVLRRHATIHGKEKPYGCELCGKTFLYSWYLKTHMNVHIGDRPYVCNLCDKCFAYKPSLKSHMRIHTGQKDFLCEVCNKSFGDHGSLKRHEKSKVHKRRELEGKLVSSKSLDERRKRRTDSKKCKNLKT